jgi:hypothetical protein
MSTVTEVLDAAAPAPPEDQLDERSSSSSAGDPNGLAFDVRDTGVAFALSGVSPEAGRALLASTQRTRRARVGAQLLADQERARFAEKAAGEALDQARSEAVATAEQLRWKSSLEEKARNLAIVIRRKRHDLEASKIADELERLDKERRETIERLTQDRTVRHQAEVQEWNGRANERSGRVNELKSFRTELAQSEKQVRADAAQRMNPRMTRTAAGFLIWAGYAVIGATATAVSLLLDDGSGRSLLNDIGASAIKLMEQLSHGRLHPLVAALLGLLTFLASLVALLVSMDLLMRWFDERRWMKTRRPGNQWATQLALPARPELGRSLFSKLLITVPLVYITGAIIAFIAYAGHVTPNRLLLGQATALLYTLVGTGLSLLSASIFVLYFSNILEPRLSTRGSQWRMVWEIGVIPFVMILAIVFVAIYGPQSRWAWAGLATFMLLGAMALAYGLLYRGMFRDIDVARRATEECDRDIEKALRPPAIDEPGASEEREVVRVLSDYRLRRQCVLDLDRERRIRRLLLTSDEDDPSLVARHVIVSKALWSVLVRRRRIAPQADFYRTTDLEAAPVETEERQLVEQEVRVINVETAAADPERLHSRVLELKRRFEDARAEYERAMREPTLLIAMNDEREASEILVFAKAYAIASSMKPSYEAIANRRDETVRVVARARVTRPARAEEVHSGH